MYPPSTAVVQPLERRQIWSSVRCSGGGVREEGPAIVAVAAFAMGAHERLGGRSVVCALPADLVRRIAGDAGANAGLERQFGDEQTAARVLAARAGGRGAGAGGAAYMYE